MGSWCDQDEVLARFRSWLDRTQAECDSLDEESLGECESETPVGLYQFVEQLTALRHDVKLMTKAARAQEEGTEAFRLSLQAAIEQFRAVEPREDEAAHKAAKPLVEAVIDVHESLLRCRGVIVQAKSRLLDELHAELHEAQQRLDALFQTQAWWRRLLCRPWHEAARGLYSGRAVESTRTIFDSLLEGYDLVEKRLSRFMAEQTIARIRCQGEQADPKRMTVMEVVTDPSRCPGTVVEEIRPGYCWNGRVLRFAEVKAVGKQ